LITSFTTTFVALFEGLILFIVGAVKSALKILEFVALRVVLAADTLHKLNDTTQKKIAIAKSNFLLILPPPHPKTTPTIFNNLNI
jgi:hypothetical protein